MIDVYLHGYLGKKYGKKHRLNVSSPAEACRALQANYNTFFAAIRPGVFKIIRGERKTGEVIPLELLNMQSDRPIHFVPIPRGSKNSKAIISAVIGIALIGVSIATMNPELAFAVGMKETAITLPVIGAISHAQIALFGGMLALGGISQLLSPVTSVSDYSSQEEKQISFLFNGPVNRSAQGGAIPLIYGRMRVGATLVSGGIHVGGGAASITEDQAATITTTCGVGASTNPAGVVTVEKGTSLTVRIHFTGHMNLISDVLVDNVSQGAISSYTFSNITADHTLEVVTQTNSIWTA
ncbi:MAG: hypothetical protein LLG06_02155 [Desulfobacteraceae bacterium]|nr:hypothetical protein [Desulfobacteraceae bacterium]